MIDDKLSIENPRGAENEDDSWTSILFEGNPVVGYLLVVSLTSSLTLFFASYGVESWVRRGLKRGVNRIKKMRALKQGTKRRDTGYIKNTSNSCHSHEGQWNILLSWQTFKSCVSRAAISAYDVSAYRFCENVENQIV